jgi:hypothetical protein
VPVLNLTEPAHLLAKLKHEFETLAADHSNSYAAINAIRDAYHLRAWIWHERLKNDPVLQLAIMTKVGSECDWNKYVNRQFTDFPVIRDLCNGSKHFVPNPKVQATHRAGYGSPLFAYGNGVLGYGVTGLFVQVDAGRIISVKHLVESVCDFWAKMFKRFPQLT